MLVGHFRWKIGEQRVAERRYCVARAGGADGGTLVTADDWERIRDKREHLVMSMLIEQIFREELQKLCPKYGETKLGSYEDQGWRVWYAHRSILLFLTSNQRNLAAGVTVGTSFLGPQSIEK
jgi:hypothetical protein